jgi:hypothetical protein
MKCILCENFDKKEECCSLDPASIDDEVCLLRWIIELLLEQQEDNDEGDNWKFS